MERQATLKQALVSGAVAGLTVDVLLHPLDTLKTRMQAHGFQPAGLYRGVYSGLLATTFGSAPNASLFFVTYEAVKRLLYPWTDSRAMVHMIAASCGEMTACTVRVPTEVIKQRLQTGQFPTTSTAVKYVLQTEGILGFFRGFSSTVAREIPFTCIQFPLYEYFKVAYAKHKHVKRLEPWEASIFGSASGAIAAALTTPLDVTKTRIILAQKHHPSAPDPGMISTMRTMLKEEGPKVLLAGMGPRMLWISLGGCIFLGMYEKTIKICLDWHLFES
ncbi:mitochondrial carrier [Hesseltinella vesiculosa]|uniref:Mitochondrial carrier n=1 Tax=Hesseltinella vesiculosa TaxID=101127 RepID=A0A1X2GF72_9FUNG|nr:mitochondrial carrier [Hesseltinella vesiculosa]